jgi:hypothetical protein
LEHPDQALVLLEGLHEATLHLADAFFEQSDGSGLAATERLLGRATQLVAKLCQLPLDVVEAPCPGLAITRLHQLLAICPARWYAQYRNAPDTVLLSVQR